MIITKMSVPLLFQNAFVLKDSVILVPITVTVYQHVVTC